MHPGNENAARDSMLDTSAFLLPADGVGCLLLHGFTATPYDMRFLGDRLHARGFAASAVRLAGHGTTPEDLEHVTWEDWYTSARDGLDELRRRTPNVVVVGQSMGALLALKLAAERRDQVAALVLLSPALVLSRRWLAWLAPILPTLLPLLGERRRYAAKGQSDIADPQAREESPTYRRFPLRALREFILLQRQARAVLPQVRQPVLVVHSRQDHTCPVDNVSVLERALRGPVSSVILDHSYHVISVDVEKERTAAEVCAFVETATSSGAAVAGFAQEV